MQGMLAGNASPRVFREGFFCLRLETEVFVDAPVESVWEILVRVDRYAEWNPALPEAAGEAVVGGELHVLIEWPGLKRDRYRLRVTEVEAGKSFAWLGRFGVRGLMDGLHRFELEPRASGGVVVRQRETFSGLLVPLFAPWLRDNVLRGFVQVNEALRERVESERRAAAS